MFTNRRPTLSFERGVDQRVACQPGDGVPVQMPYSPPIEADVLRDIAALVHAGEPGIRFGIRRVT